MEQKKKTITITVSFYEAAMIAKMRKYQYGIFKVHKMDGEPRRIITEGSEAINPNDYVELDDVKSYIKKGV
jgi:hypothetical protein